MSGCRLLLHFLLRLAGHLELDQLLLYGLLLLRRESTHLTHLVVVFLDDHLLLRVRQIQLPKLHQLLLLTLRRDIL